MMNLFKRVLAVLAVTLLFTGYASAASVEITCSQNNCYVVNNLEGELTVGTKGDFDINLVTGQDSTATGVTIGATTGDVVPLADGVVDLGTSSLEFEDLHIDGTANIDTLAASAVTVTGDLTMATAASQIVPGATSFAIRTTADDADNLIITDAGLATFIDHIDLTTSGKTLVLEDGTASTSCIGTVTANGTTEVPVSTTCAQTGDYIFFSANAADVNTANCWAHQISDGVDFDFDCDAASTTTFNWIIIKGQ